MSPEYAMGGIFSEKSDVFSFGILILEIVSGRKNTSFTYHDEHQSLIAHVSSKPFKFCIQFSYLDWMYLKINAMFIYVGMATLE